MMGSLRDEPLKYHMCSVKRPHPAHGDCVGYAREVISTCGPYLAEVIWFEAHHPKSKVAGYFFRTWNEADTWLYSNGISSGLNWKIREVWKPRDWEPIKVRLR